MGTVILSGIFPFACEWKEEVEGPQALIGFLSARSR